MSSKITVFWFRLDLRLADNPGFFAAAQDSSVLPIYILDDRSEMGGATKWWLHHSLSKLNHSLDNKLNVYIGNPEEIILKLLSTHNINAVYWNRGYEPWRISADSALKSKLRNLDIDCQSFNGSLLWEPWKVLKKDNTPYKVYTPFYRKGCNQAAAPRFPLPAPEKMDLLQDLNNQTSIDDLKLLPAIKWYRQLEPHWDIGENAAQIKLQRFLDSGLEGYNEKRNFPAKAGTSRLSPHLHFGEISPNQVWYAAQGPGIIHHGSKGLDQFLSELAWREFSYYLLYHFPELPRKNFQAKFDQFPWQDNAELLKAWQQGKTGYPLVDAGMRELWQTGYMHNRVRMVVGSFLVKNLLLNWHHGEDWFWDCLVDADLASNSASWQWVAGSGADAAPYFRIFNPVLQGEKFDPEGHYTKHFVPELAQLPKQFLYKPWLAPPEVLKRAGVELGTTYPRPIVDLALSRQQALEAYRSIKEPSL